MKRINNKCVICGSNSFHHHLYGNDYFYETTTKIFEIIKCDNCGLEQVFPIPKKEEQLTFYPKNYYSYSLKKNKLKGLFFNIMQGIFSIFKDKTLELPKYNGGGKNFLDIGCGDGANLDIVSNLGGRNCYGFEISDFSSFKDNIYYGESIVDTEFKEKFDYIRCSHVFEHIDNPKKFLNRIREILKDNGVLVIRLPNVNCIMSVLFGPYASDRDIPRHLFNYSYKNIQVFFKEQGFEVIKKKKYPQVNSFTSFSWLIKDKFGINISNNFLGRLLSLFFILVDFLCCCVGSTNQMAFLLKKSD